MNSWLRRNRWGLVLLLPALAAALIGASFRLTTGWAAFSYWREHPPVGFAQHFSLDGVDYFRQVDVRLVASSVLEFPPGANRPADTTLLQLDVGFAAPPDSPLSACTVTLVDGQGRSFTPIGGMDDGDVTTQAGCVPVAAPGPIATGLDLPDSGEQRPASWERGMIFLLPTDARPVALRLGWTPPDVVVIPLG